MGDSPLRQSSLKTQNHSSQTAKSSAKSAVSGARKAGSPAGKASAVSAVATEQKKQKLPLWLEWNENDINAEKWESGGRTKEPNKTKPTSAPVSHGFEDPDPKFDWPYSIQSRIDSYKRPSEVFEKTPVIVDPDSGLDNFDLINPNEHLHNSETMRWIISQIHTLWDICRKDMKSSYFLAGSPSQALEENLANKAVLAGRLWRPWEHIYAINKVTKGPFIPVYNPHGKYVVRLYFMGTWRKVVIDDLIPVDEKGVFLLPQSSINGELWPLLLSKALMKIISLDFNPSDSATEFNDVSIITCLTGWLPEPLPLRFGHMSEVWKFLRETLPKYQWPDEKSKAQEEESAQDLSDIKEDQNTEKDNSKLDGKDKKKTAKDSKATSGKDTKLDKHKKDPKDKKGKSAVDEPQIEENFAPEFPEMVLYASFTDLPLNKLSASTEVADRRERLRKYNLNHDFSNPVWITCTRDISLNPPPPPEKVPVWKTIRQRKKNVVPSDEPIPTITIKPDQWVELKSPFVGFKAPNSIQVVPTNRTNSRFSSRMRSRPATAIQGIEEIDEKVVLENLESDSINDFSKENPIDTTPKQDDLDNSKNKLLSRNKQPSVIDQTKVGKKEREKSFDAAENTITKKDQTIKKDDELTNIKSKFTKKSTKKHGISINSNDAGAAQGNQSINGTEHPNIVVSNETKLFTDCEYKPLEGKNKLWMDFEDFFVCFKSIIVYHKPSSFKYSEKYSELKQVTIQQQKQEKQKKDTNSLSQIATLDEKLSRLLFVDSLTSIEIIISFASLSRWYEQRVEVTEKPLKQSKKQDSNLAEIPADLISVAETVREITPLQLGSLMAEPYTWKSLVTGQPVLRIHTTAIRSAYLTLPPGRHVLKFMISAPVGYHINIVSNTRFFFGDEEEIMPKLTDESCRFVDQSMHIMRSLSEAIKYFNDSEKQKPCLELLINSISPLTDAYLKRGTGEAKLSKKMLIEIFQYALYEMIHKVLGDNIDAETTNAWKVFLFDCSPNDALSMKERRPETSSTNRGSATNKKLDKKKEQETNKKDLNKQQSQAAAHAEKEITEEKLEYWKSHVPSAAEQIAAVKVQMIWRGYYIRKMYLSRMPNNPRNMGIHELLKKSWSYIEQNLQENGLYLFRAMFKMNQEIMQYYPFYKDEWNRIAYFDYNGSYIDQPSNSWFVLFRDVFFANEKVLLLPKLYCNLNNCLMRVINNDTYKEIPKVFNKVSPYTYAKNKKGYTIIAEARIPEQPCPSGKWRLRLIGSSPSLICPRNNKTDIISAFDIRETKDYYMPNENKTILRFKVTVSEDNLTSIQLSTSKSDVYLSLSIYDNGEEMITVTGKGTAFIPAFIFLKDPGDIQPIEQNNLQGASRPPSKTFSSGRTSKGIDKNEKSKESSKNKRSLSSNSNELKESKQPHSRSSSRQSLAQEVDDEDATKPHKYIIEASVLKESWPLSPSQWAFVNNLKEHEAAEMKVFSKDRTNSPTGKEGKMNADNKAAVLKANKSKVQKSKTPASNAPSRPASSAFDVTKPHWILKWVSDATMADAIEVKKDTDRVEEIKALKRNWENHEAGRAAKAMIKRQEFLKAHLVKLDGSITDDETEKTTEEEVSTIQPATLTSANTNNSQQPQLQKQITLSEQKLSTQLSTTAVSGPTSTVGILKTQDSISKSKANKNDDQKQSNKQSKGSKQDNKKDKIESKTSQDLVAQQAAEQLFEPGPVEEILTNRPPTPPKPKVFLPPIDIKPFLRSNNMGPIYKNESFEKEQDELRKQDVKDFLAFKEQMLKFRDEERRYRYYQKLKQIEDCETLQAKLEASRKEVFEPREAFRQIFLEAERKRLEEIAAQEASIVSLKADPNKDKKKASAGKGGKKK